MLFEQTLIQKRVPFDIVFDSTLKDLSRYKVLVLADQESIGDRELDLIREFVHNGGGLVAVGTSTIYNERRIRRLDFGLSDLFGCHYPYNGDRPSFTVRNTYGKGRVVYIPRIRPSIPPPPDGFNGTVPGKYWKLPANAGELYAAVKWASGDTLSLEADAPDSVAAELRRRPDGSYVLHLLDYDTGAEHENLDVRLRLPEAVEGYRVTLRSPDFDEDVRLEAKFSGGRFRFRVPALKTYDVILIEPQP